MWICGQYWPLDDLAEIAIIDDGIGIYRSMIKNKAHRECIKTNLSAIEMALKAGISESFSLHQKIEMKMYGQIRVLVCIWSVRYAKN